jgi:hypothetical protein
LGVAVGVGVGAAVKQTARMSAEPTIREGMVSFMVLMGNFSRRMSRGLIEA